MRNLFKIVFLIIVMTYLPNSLFANSAIKDTSERNYFQFVIPKYQTSRQSGQIVDVYVRYAYKKGLSTNQYVDYRILRTKVLKYMEPTDDLPAQVFWEIIATKMGKDLIEQFPLDGISIQLNVHDNSNPDSYEPGDHGPIFTVGDIAPLDVHY